MKPKISPELNKKITKAKEFAHREYNERMKKHGAYNPNYKRYWRPIQLHSYPIAYALNGSPDKAFVVVKEDGTVVALSQALNILKVFK